MAGSKVSLNMLPAELLLRIFDFLPLQAHRSLNLTNRHLYDLSLDHLYTTSPGINEQLLLRTLARPGNADLAKRVRNVICKLYTRSHLPRMPLEDGRVIADAFLTLPLSIADNRKIDMANTFLTEHLGGEPGSLEYFEFFLLFLPNVEGLEIVDAWQWDDHEFWFTSLDANANYFGRLKRAKIRGPMRIENVVPLINVPTLQELELWEVTVMRRAVGEIFDWEYPGQSISEKLLEECSIRTLTLRQSYIDTATLLPIFKATRCLESFTYEHRRHDLSFETDMPLDYEALSRCFAHQAATLQHVDIGNEEMNFKGEEWLQLLGAESDSPLDQAGMPALGNLKSLFLMEFSLKDLTLNAFGDDDEHEQNGRIATSQFVKRLVVRLPSTLQVLRIVVPCIGDPWPCPTQTDCGMFLSCLVEELRLTGIGGLKSVQVGGLFRGNVLTAAEVQQLKRTFGTVGVEFVYQPDDIEAAEVKKRDPGYWPSLTVVRAQAFDIEDSSEDDEA